ncbi:MAG: IMP dehydrogenase [Nitrososphaerales archaeon]
MTKFVGPEYDFDDVLVLPKRSMVASRSDINILREFFFYNSPKRLETFPICSSNMYCTGSMEMARALSKFKSITCLHKFYPLKELQEFYSSLEEEFEYCWLSIGTREEDLQKLKDLYKDFRPNICLDSANGQSEKFIQTCAKVRDIIGDSILMAGNVVTAELVHELIVHGGADFAKIGLGSGAQCQTRSVTSVGRPQLSAVIECADAAHGLRSGKGRLGLVCSDGGVREIGDICRAYGGGADIVMLGAFLAGAEECIGEWEYEIQQEPPIQVNEYIPRREIYAQGKYREDISHIIKYDPDFQRVLVSVIKDGATKKEKIRLNFYGMSSTHAQELHYPNGKPDYAASEGKVSWVDYKGPVEGLIKEIQGGVRSFCSYIGANSLKDAPRCTTFIVRNK